MLSNTPTHHGIQRWQGRAIRICPMRLNRILKSVKPFLGSPQRRKASNSECISSNIYPCSLARGCVFIALDPTETTRPLRSTRETCFFGRGISKHRGYANSNSLVIRLVFIKRTGGSRTLQQPCVAFRTGNYLQQSTAHLSRISLIWSKADEICDWMSRISTSTVSFRSRLDSSRYWYTSRISS